MTFSPTKKTSKSRTRRRTTNWIKLTAKKLANRVCLNSEATGLAHFIDENGNYKWKNLIAKKVKKRNITRV